MTRFVRFLRRLLEKLLDRWSEGPDPPRRIAEEARLFRHAYPNATPDEWERFTVRFAGNCYRDAFVRGFEWNERCWPDRDIEPDRVAAELQLDASVGDGDPRVRRLLAKPPPSLDSDQLRLIDELARSHYPFHIEFHEDE